jgi:calcium-dependent protein kinase
VDQVMQRADMDGSGLIDYSEWKVASSDKVQLLNKQNLKNAFSMLDSDSTGYIDMDNIKNIFGVTRKAISDDVWKKVIEEVDLNGDGVISFNEFENLMKKFTS